MNKSELIQAVAEQTGIPTEDTEKAIEAFISVVSEELSSEGQIMLIGFGTFQVTHRPERIGVNPRTGEALKIPARNVPIFKPGKNLKEKVK